jgi:hypothetical protein
MAETTTVADLIKILRTLPSDAIVVLAKDREGGGFSPLAKYGYSVGRYEAGTTRVGKFTSYPDEENQDDGEDYFDPTAGVEAVVLWPTN